ncbi:sialidase family protein [Pedobacter arcticus]|uniref:sialidase family protein n=1 Tax=Pedobacter arcticus TaxID=752140 RepID=UPI001375D43B|nr:sialidase family protein [Pedobacter arcticus]
MFSDRKITTCVFKKYLTLVFVFFCYISVNAQEVPGVVVAKAIKGSYVASPAIAILPDGSYVVSHDRYGVLYKNEPRVTVIYRSVDKGVTWSKQGEVSEMYWASLFVNENALYLLGTRGSIGDVVISKSTDKGKTWTTNHTQDKGLLFKGRYHTAPTAVVKHNGRVWKAYEEDPDSKNTRRFEALVISAPEKSDLLNAKNWQRSNGIVFDTTWLNARLPIWREGNMVVAPNGDLIDLIRLETRQKPKDTYKLHGIAEGMLRYEVAGKLAVSPDGKKMSFDTKTGLVHFPGAETKFTVRYDPVSKKYWSLVNKITANKPGSSFKTLPNNQRNVVMLTSSPDLVNWTEHTKVLRWNEGKTTTMEDKYAFQYLDFVFDGGDIIAVSRTAWNSINYHDSNYITFHRFKNFRTMTMADSPADLADTTN